MNRMLILPNSVRQTAAFLAIIALLATSFPAGVLFALAEDTVAPVETTEVTPVEETTTEPEPETTEADEVAEEVPETDESAAQDDVSDEGADEDADAQEGDVETPTSDEVDTTASSSETENVEKGIIATTVEKVSEVVKSAVDALLGSKTNEVTLSMVGDVATIDVVELDKTYVAPQNSQVKVTFTELPEVAGSLSIEEVELTPEQVEALGALSNIAYDITSNMANGTFAYTLELPKPDGAEDASKVVYAETQEELVNAKEVSESQVNIESDKVVVDELNHFTIFVVTYVAQEFGGLSPWSADRTAPTGGQSISPDELSFSVIGSSSHGTAFYKTEGLKAAVPSDKDGVKATLKIDSGWSSVTDVRAGLWGVFSAASTASLVYPIIEFTNFENNPRIRVWDTSTGTWFNTASSASYGADVTLEIVQDSYTNEFKFFVDGSLVHKYSSIIGGNNFNQFKEVIFNSYNGGSDYTTVWTDLQLGEAELKPTNNTTVVVKPSQLNGWSQTTSGGGTVGFIEVVGAPMADGVLNLKTIAATSSRVRLSKSVEFNLADLTEISYQSKQVFAATPTTGAASFRLVLDLDGDLGTSEDSREIIYEPYYNFAAYNPLNPTGINTGEWQTWKMTRGEGKFWAGGFLGSGGGGAYATNFTINDVLLAYPNAKVIGISLGLGTYNGDWDIQVDDLKVGYTTDSAIEITTYDFEPHINQIPTLTVDIPSESSFVSTNANDDKLRVIGTFTDDSAVNYAQLELVYAGNLVTVYTMHYINPGLNPDGSFSVDIPVTGLVDGEYSLFYTGTDFDGGVGPRQERKFTIDNTAPTTPSITKPTPRQWFRTTPIQTEWTPSTDEGSGIKGYQVAYSYDDGHLMNVSHCPEVTSIDGKVVSGCRDAPGTTRGQVPELFEQGGVTIWVRAIDNAGNASPWSSSVHYYYDATVPETTLVVPVGVAANTFTVHGKATDNLSLNRVYVQLVHRQTSQRYGGTTIHLSGTEQDWSREFDATTLGMPEGDYAAHVSVVDNAGNTASVGWSDDFTLDNTPPAVPMLESPADNSFQNFNDFYFEWSDFGDAVGYEIQYSQSGNVGDDGSFVNVDWTGDYQKNQPAESRARSVGAVGTWYWQVRAVDAAGNKSAWTAPWKMTIDMDAPVAPVITNSPVYVNLAQANNQATWSHPESGVVTYEYREYRNQSEADADTDGNTASYWIQNKSVSQLSQTVGQSWTGYKVLYYRVVAIDPAGNRSAPSELGTVIIDKVRPTVSLISPTSTGPFANSVTIQVDAEDNHGLNKITANIYKEGVLVKSTSASIGGNTTGTHATVVNLPDGEYIVRYNASDLSGTLSMTYEYPFVIGEDAEVLPEPEPEPVDSPEAETPVSQSSITTFGSRGGSSSVASAPSGQVLGASTDDGDFCVDPYIIENLAFGWNNNVAQVTRLQGFLNRTLGLTLPTTGFFGELTRQAVMSFQTRYAADILAPWGISTPTGMVYHTTKKKINELVCEGQREFPLTQEQQNEIDGVRSNPTTPGSVGSSNTTPTATVAGASTQTQVAVTSDEETLVNEEQSETQSEPETKKPGFFKKLWNSVFGN